MNNKLHTYTLYSQRLTYTLGVKMVEKEMQSTNLSFLLAY